MTPLDATSHIAPKKILFATDFSPTSEAALPYAFSLADHYGSNLYFAHVIALEYPDFPPPDERGTKLEEAREFTERELKRLLEASRQKGISCEPLIGDGTPWSVLSEMIHKNSIDLTIVGTHGTSRLEKATAGFGCGGGASDGAVSGAHGWPEDFGNGLGGCAAWARSLSRGVCSRCQPCRSLCCFAGRKIPRQAHVHQDP